MINYFRKFRLPFLLIIFIGFFVYAYFTDVDVKMNYKVTAAEKSLKINTTPLEKYMHDNYDNKGYNGYTFVLAVKQPVPGTRIIAAQDLDTGHVFIRLAKSGKKGWVSYFSRYLDNITSDDRSLSKIKIHSDITEEFTLAKVFHISEEDTNAVIKYLWDNYKKPADYDIAFDNCVTFALEATKVANIDQSLLGIEPRQWEIPSYIRDNPLVMYYINLKTKSHFGYSAGDAGEDLKAKGNVIYYEDLLK